MSAGALRLLLLALLSLGVIGMHTVGHSTDHHAWDALSDAGSGHAVTGVVADGDGPRLTDGAHPCGGTCAVAAPAMAFRGTGSDPAQGDVGVVVMCLAVLLGLGVLAMIAGALAGRHRPGPGAASASWARVRRAGPVPPGFALRLVDVAVLRT